MFWKRKEGTKWRICRLILLITMLALGLSFHSVDTHREEFTKEMATKQKETLTELTITIPVPSSTLGNTVLQDRQMVEEALNNLTMEQLHIKTNILWIEAPYDENQLVLLSSKQKIDVMFAGSFETMYHTGYMLPLNNLMANYGKDIPARVGKNIMLFGNVDGMQYAIPTCRDYAMSFGYCMREDILEKYGLSIESIETMEDLSKIFETVHENEPSLIVLSPMYPYMTFLLQPDFIDPLGDYFGVLDNRSEGYEVVNFFETEEYKKQLDIIRSWYKKGYIPEDIVAMNYSGSDLVKKDELFCFSAFMKPGYASQETITTGHEMTTVTIYDPILTTKRTVSMQWFINKGTRVATQAMKLLNFLFTSTDAMNLLCWGVEGVHYSVLPNGLITYPEGVDFHTVGYAFGAPWMLPNSLCAGQWKGGEKDIETKMKDFNENSPKSKAYGFIFDPTPVQEIYIKVANISRDYRFLLETGAVSPQAELPKFLATLEEAGLQEVLKEKQRQLDEWVSSQMSE